MRKKFTAYLLLFTLLFTSVIESNFFVFAEDNTKELIFYCDKEEHNHIDTCYSIYNVLDCEESHIHEGSCFSEYKFLDCTEEEHTHDKNCEDKNYKEPEPEVVEPTEEEKKIEKALKEEDNLYISCENEEHTHIKECFKTYDLLNCKEEHEHIEECSIKAFEIICEKEEHSHNIDCVGEKEQEEIEEITEELLIEPDVTFIEGDKETEALIAENLDTEKEVTEALVEQENMPKSQARSVSRNLMNTPMKSGLAPEGVERQGDGSNIENISAKWITTDTEDNDDPALLYVKPPGYTDNEQIVKLQINYALSGEHDYEPGDVTITVPAHIFKDRDGSDYGKLIIPYAEEPSTKNDFNWKRVGDNYILTNTRRMSAATKGYIQFAISGLIPHEIVDMEETAPFSAYIEVVTHKGNIIGLESNDLTAQIDTEAKVTSATKRVQGEPTRVPASEIPESQRIAGEEEYIVINWSLWGRIQSNTMYDLKMEDVIIDDYEGFIVDISSGYTTNRNLIDERNVEDDIYDIYRGGDTRTWNIKSAYPASQFDPDVEYVFNNKVVLTLTEEDPERGSDPQLVTTAEANANTTFIWHLPEWKDPTGHFMVWKNGNDDNVGKPTYTTHKYYDYYNYNDRNLRDNGYWGIYNKALNDLRDGAETYEIAYTVNTLGYIMPWTYESDGTPEGARKLSNYGRHEVTMVTEEMGVRIVGVGDLTLHEDYEYKAIEFPYVPIIYSAVPHNINPDGSWVALTAGDGTFLYSEDTDVTHIPEVILEIYKDNEWIEYAKANYTTGEPVVSLIDGTPVEGIRVELPEGTENFRTKTTTNLAGMSYDMRPIIELKNVNKISTLVEKAFSTSNVPTINVYNTVNMKAYVDDSTESLLYLQKDGFDKLRGYKVDTKIVPKKSSRQTLSEDVDFEKRLVTIHYSAQVEQRSYINDKIVYEEAIADGSLSHETSGVWRDLLPKGVTPVLDTIRLRDKDKIVNAYTIENYKNSGRTLLVVEAELTPVTTTYRENGEIWYEDVITISFDATYGFDDIIDYGDNIHNVISYESGRNSFGSITNYKAEPDDPSVGNNTTSSEAFEDDIEKALMTNLNTNHDNPVFVYAGDWITLNLLSAARTSLSKDVMTNFDGWWSDGLYYDDEEANKRIVYTSGYYQYRLRMMSDTDTISKDLILYDSLENFYAGDGNDDIDIDAPRWQGKLKSIDVSQLEAMGCAPVIYYSTVENLILSDESNPNYANHTNTDLTNNEIWIRADEYTGNIEDVKAVAIDASKTTEGEDFTLEPLESVVVLFTMKAPDAEEAAIYIAEDAHAYNNAYLLCTSIDSNTGAADSDNFVRKDYTKVGLEEYKLTVRKVWNDDNNRDGIRPEEITVRLYADGVDTGKTLTISDTETHEFTNLPYTTPDGQKIIYSIKEDAVDNYTYNISRNDLSFVITNKHEPEKISLSGTKTWINDSKENRPEYIVVNLYANDTKIKSLTVRPNLNDEWNYEFTNLFKYENGVEISYRVEETGPKALNSYTAEYDGLNITNTYNPYGDLSLTKQVENETSACEGQEFTFVFTFTKDNEPVTEQFNYEIISNDTVVKTGTISTNDEIKLKKDETIHITNIPEYVNYTISEETVSGYVIRSSSNLTGTIIPNTTQEAFVINEYRTEGRLNISLDKLLTNRKISKSQFIFEMYDENGMLIKTASNSTAVSTTMREDGTVENSKATATFGALYYNESDHGETYIYTIKERNRNKPGYSYDDREFIVTVTPIDNGNGTMTVNYTVQGQIDCETCQGTGIVNEAPCEVCNGTGKVEGETVLSFENEYSAEGEVTLRAWKTLEGRRLTDNEFEFELLDEEGNVLQTKTNSQDGSIVFDAIHYTAEDIGKTYYYAIREKVGTDETVNYDSNVYAYNVQVLDNGDGTLTCTQTPVDVSNRWINKSPIRYIDYFSIEGHSEHYPYPWWYNKFSTEDINLHEYGGLNFIFENSEIEFYNKSNPGCLMTGLIYEKNDTSWTTRQNFFIQYIPKTLGEHISSIYTGGWYAPVNIYEIDDSAENIILLCADGEPEPYNSVDFPESVKFRFIEVMPAEHTSWQEIIDILESGNKVANSDFTLKEITEGEFIEKTEGQTLNPNWEPKEGELPVFKNTLKPGNLSIEKTIEGSGPDQEFKFKVKLIGADIENREFEITREKLLYNTYLTYDANGGTFEDGESKNQFTYIVNKGNATLLAGEYLEPTREMYVFDGWYEDRECTIEFTENPEEASVIENKTIYAKWKKTNAYAVLDDDGNLIMFRSVNDYTNDTTGTFIDIEGNEYIGRIFAGLETTNSSATYNSKWYNYRNTIKTVSIAEGQKIRPIDTSYWFNYCHSMTFCDLAGLDTSKVTDMSRMFISCRSLVSLDLSHFDTSKVTNMAYMFDSCRSLASLDLSHFDTSKVTNMSRMFISCRNLVSLDLSHFDTSKVTNMSSMFSDCYNLVSLDLSHFDTSKVTNMSSMFNDCRKLTTTLNIMKMPSDYRDMCYYAAIQNGAQITLRYIDPVTSANIDTLVATKDSNNNVINGGEGTFIPPDTSNVWNENNPSPAKIVDNTSNNNNENPENNSEENTENPGTSEDPEDIIFENGEAEFTLKANDKIIFNNIPAGTTYQVYEETPDGWVLIEQENISGIIQPLETSEAKFTNKYQPGTASVQFNGTKTLDNRPATEGAFSFELWEGNTLLETVSTLDGGFIQFSVINYLPEDIGTHTYRIVEVNPNRNDIDYDTHEEFITVEVTGDVTNLTTNVTYDSDGINFSNMTRPGSLEIKKNATGTSTANQNDEFTLRITFENENGVPLSGDENIYYYKKDSRGNIIQTRGLLSTVKSWFIGEPDMDSVEIESIEGSSGSGGKVELIKTPLKRDLRAVSKRFEEEFDFDAYPGDDATIIESDDIDISSKYFHYDLYSDGTLIISAIEGRGRAKFQYKYSDGTANTGKITGLERIKHIRFDNSKGYIFGAMDRAFYNMKNLISIDFTGVDNIEALEFFNLPNLKYIEYGGARYTGNYMIRFSNCQSIETIQFNNLIFTRAGSNGTPIAENCVNLKELSLEGTNAKPPSTYTGFVASGCPNLEKITLTATSNFNLYYHNSNDLRPGGMWYNQDTSQYMTFNELSDNWSESLAGTWIKCFPVVAFEPTTGEAILYNRIPEEIPKTENTIIAPFEIPRDCIGEYKEIVKSFKMADEVPYVRTLSGMFEDCINLSEVDVSKFNTKYLLNWSTMFKNTAIEIIDLSSWAHPNALRPGSRYEHSAVFQDCSKLKHIILPPFSGASTTSYSSWYNQYFYSGLKVYPKITMTIADSIFTLPRRHLRLDDGYITNGIDFPDDKRGDWVSYADWYAILNRNTGQLTLYNYPEGYEYQLQDFETKYYIDCNKDIMSLFSYKDNSYFGKDDALLIKTVTFEGDGIIPKALFANCINLETCDFNGAGIETENLYGLFFNCKNLKTVDISHFQHVISMQYTFQECSALEDVAMPALWTPKIYDDLESAFRSCNLHILDLSSLDMTEFSGSSGSIIAWHEYPQSLDTLILGENAYSEKQVSIGNPLTITDNDRIIERGWPFDPSNYLPTASSPGTYHKRRVGIWFDLNGGISTPNPTNFIKKDYREGDSYHRVGTIIFNSSEFVNPGYHAVSLNTQANGSGHTYLLEQSYSVSTTMSTPYNVENIETVRDFASKQLVLYPQWEYDGLNSIIVNHLQETLDNGSYVNSIIEQLRALPGETVTTEIKNYPGFHTTAVPETITIPELDEDVIVINYYYDRDRYTVSFNGNGAETGQMFDVIEAVGDVQYALPKNIYGKKGAIFTGWNTEPDGSGVSFTDKASIKNIGAHGDKITLYAQWQENNTMLEPSSGVIEVTIKAGETLIIPDLPAGTKYTIEEINNPDGWTTSGYVNENGTIIANTASQAQVNNRYNASGFAQLIAHKNMVGRYPENGEFTFELLQNNIVIDTKTNEGVDLREEIGTETGVIKNPYYEYAPVYFDEIEFNRAGTYTYQIREVVREGNITYDAHIENVTIVMTDMGGGLLKADVRYDTDGPIFTNILYPGSLEIGKNVENATDISKETEFDFTIIIKDKDGNELTDEYLAKKKHVNYGVVESEVPAVRYSHMENLDDQGNKLSDYANNKTFNEVVNIPGAEALHIKITYGGESTSYDWVCMWEGNYPNYTAYNDWSSSVTGKLGGSYGTREYDIEGDTVTFAFRSDGSGLGSGQAKGYGYYAVVTAEGVTETALHEEGYTDGTITSGETFQLKGGEFLDITGLPDGATYEIVENNKPGWENTYKTGETGLITAGEKSEAFFINEYDTNGNIVLEGTKSFIGGDLSEKTFYFEVTNEDGDVVTTGQSKEDGTIEFTPIDYTIEDVGNTYTYYIKESNDGQEGVTYDSHIEIVTVEVNDNGNGTISGNITYDEDGIVFNNFILQELEVSKEVTGTMGNKEQDFTFTLELSGDYDKHEITYTKGTETGTVDSNKFTFTLKDNETIKFSGIVKGVEYTITENNYSSEGYTTNAETSNGEIGTTLLGKVKASGELTEDTTVKYTNTRETVVPTKVSLYDNNLYILMGLISLIGILFFIKRKVRD